VLTWREQQELPFNFLSRLKQLIWPRGVQSPCVDLTDPEVVQNLFAACVHAGAVGRNQRVIFFAEAACDVRLARVRPGGILKENIWKNRRWARRDAGDLDVAQQMIHDLDSGEHAKRKAEQSKQHSEAKLRGASHSLNILLTSDPWTHVPAKVHRARVSDATSVKSVADKVQEDARAGREFLYGPTLDAMKFQELEALVAGHAVYSKFLKSAGAIRLIKFERDALLELLEATAKAKADQERVDR